MADSTRYEQIFETIAAGVLVQKPSGEIVFANDVAQEILTFPMDELANKTSEDPVWHMILEDGSFVPGEEHPSMVTLRTGKPLRNEVRGLFANDPTKVRWLSINTEPVFAEAATKPIEVVVTFVDITPLKIGEHRYSQLFATIGSCVAVYEPINNGADFILVDMNPAGLDSVKRNKSDVVGQKVTEAFPAVKDIGLFDVFQRVHQTGKTEHLPLTRYEDDRVEGYVENTVYRLPNGHIVAVYDDTSERHFAEEALRESEEKYRILFEAAQDAIFLADADTGMMIDCNPKAEELIGYSRKELKELHQTDLHPPDEREFYSTEFSRATKESGAIFRGVFVAHKDGRKIPVEISAGSTARLAGRNVHLGIFRDISQRLKAQKELEETLAATTDGIWSWNLVDNEVSFSPRYYTMLGFEPGEFSADVDTWLGLMHPEDREESSGRVNRFLRANPRPDTFENDFRLRTKSGEYRYIRSRGKVVERDSTGQAIRMIGNHQDITERIKQEFQYSRMLQASVDGFWFTHMDGTLLEVNASAAEMLGYTIEELQGKNVRELEATESSEESSTHIQKIVEKGFDRFETRHYKKDGTIIDVEVSAAYLSTTKKNFVIFVRDISQKKQAERDRKKLEAQLLQSQKMEAIGRLAGGIAHDFNNLLTTIVGNISLTSMDHELSESLAEALKEIDEAAERGADLTRQLLAFSRKQVIEPKVIEPNSLLENLQKLLGRVLGEDIEISWLFEANDCIRADRSQMEQVIVNLAVNARDAMPRGGSVTFATKSLSVKDNDYVAFSVRDNGTGMDEETQSRIFEPFFTTKPSEIGTGLGLATVFGIVKQHDGWIDVESKPGLGTSFTVYLPAIDESCVLEEAHDEELSKSSVPKVILVVEDDAPVRNIAMRILARDGYKSYCAESGPAALELVKEKDLKIDLLLTDIVMPQMNGKQLADALSEMQPDTKVLFVSGYTEDVISQHGILDPETNFLSKPYRPSTLLKKLREILG